MTAMRLSASAVATIARVTATDARSTRTRIWTREYNEGTHGAIYRVCKSCYDKQQRALMEELRYYESQGYGMDW